MVPVLCLAVPNPGAEQFGSSSSEQGKRVSTAFEVVAVEIRSPSRASRLILPGKLFIDVLNNAETITVRRLPNTTLLRILIFSRNPIHEHTCQALG